jgi:hypothetical protein
MSQANHTYKINDIIYGWFIVGFQQNFVVLRINTKLL